MARWRRKSPASRLLTVYSDADQRKHQSSASLTGEFPAQRASNAENASIWWRHHDINIQIAIFHKKGLFMLTEIYVYMYMQSGVLTTSCSSI